MSPSPGPGRTLVGTTAGALAGPGAAVGLAPPWRPGFATGAMLFIVSDEVIPETHGRDSATHATFALMGGFALMTFLAATLG